MKQKHHGNEGIKEKMHYPDKTVSRNGEKTFVVFLQYSVLI
jgi:hypothetical protein